MRRAVNSVAKANPNRVLRTGIGVASAGSVTDTMSEMLFSAITPVGFHRPSDHLAMQDSHHGP